MNEIERLRILARLERGYGASPSRIVDVVKRSTKLSKRVRNALISEIVELYNE